MKKRIKVLSDTIASGTTSAALDLNGWSLYAIELPGSFSSTTCTFTGCDTKGGTYVALNDDAGNAISITVAASKIVTLLNKHLALRGMPWLKAVYGSSETAKTVKYYLVEE